jgi:hypothetical protein
MRPDEAIDVGDAEYTDLMRDGLILVDHTEQAAASAPATKKAATAAATKEG